MPRQLRGRKELDSLWADRAKNLRSRNWAVLEKRRLKFDLELLDVGRLQACGGNPLLHLGRVHDETAVLSNAIVDPHVIGHEARDHGRVHRVGRAALAEQERAASLAEAVAPDLANAVNVGL